MDAPCSAGRGKDLRQRGFPASGRAPKNKRVEPARMNQLAQQPRRTQQVLLSNELLDVGRPHALRQGGARSRRRGGGRSKQIHLAVFLEKPRLATFSASKVVEFCPAHLAL